MSTTHSPQNLKSKASSCGHKRRAHPYQFQGDIADHPCVVCEITHCRVIYRAVYLALLGTILMVTVQGDVLVSDSATPLASLRTRSTFVLVYSASTYSMVSSRQV